MRAKEFLLNELNMAPGNLAKFVATSPIVANMQAGFEAELIFPGEAGDSSPGEEDLDQDKTLPRSVDLGDIADFFNTVERHLHRIDEEYMDFLTQQEGKYIEGEIDERISYLQSNDEELDDDDAREKAWDELSGEYYQGSHPDWYEFLHDELGLSSYYDVFTNWSNILDWPHFTQEGGFTEAVANYASDLESVIGAEVNTSEEYHGQEKNFRTGDWYMEPDTSIDPGKGGHAGEYEEMGVEIVSPPMPIAVMLTKFKKTLSWAKNNDARTNQTTGFHVGVSMGSSTGSDNRNTSNVDYVKLALFLGDQYILDRFGRQANTYAHSSQLLVQQMAYRMDAGQIANQLAKLKQGLVNEVSKDLLKGNDSKFVSVNMRPGYIEFRGMGNDYIDHPEVIENTILRYIRAYAVAADPQAERQEYFKKLSKLLNPGSDDYLDPFVRFAMGDLAKSDLVNTLSVRKQIKQANKAKAQFQPQQGLPPLTPPEDDRPQFTAPAIPTPPTGTPTT